MRRMMLSNPGFLAVAAGVVALATAAAAAAAGDTEPRQLTIRFSAPPEVSVEPLGDEEEFTGHLEGVVPDDADSLFAGAAVTCEFDGYTQPARGFSCGFTTAELVSGRCLFTSAKGDTAVAEWSCQTAATMTPDARCEGKADWVQGTGFYAGITGSARLHSDLFLQPGEGYAKWKGSWSIPQLAGLTN